MIGHTPMNRYLELNPEDQKRYDRAINAEASGAKVTIVIERNAPATRSVLCEECEADLGVRPPAWMLLEPWQDLVARVLPDHKFAYAHDVPAPKGNQ